MTRCNMYVTKNKKTTVTVKFHVYTIKTVYSEQLRTSIITENVSDIQQLWH